MICIRSYQHKKDEMKAILISSFLCIIIGSGNDFHPRTPSAPHDIINRPAQSIQHVAQILFLQIFGRCIANGSPVINIKPLLTVFIDVVVAIAFHFCSIRHPFQDVTA